MKHTKQESIWRMNLQLFAEEAPEGNTETAPATDENAGKETGSDKLYSIDEITKLIQSESDKRVTQALAKQKREYDKKLSLSNLSENERALAEKDNEIADLKNQLTELAQFRARQSVMNELTARSLNPVLADVIAMSDDETEMKTRIDTFEKAFRQAVEDAVKTRLAGGTAPQKGSSSTGMTREMFRKLPLSKQQEMYTKDPETYKKMTEG
jgi:hypothetical protein